MPAISNLVSTTVMRQSFAAMFNGGAASNMGTTGYKLTNGVYTYLISATNLTYEVVDGKLESFPTGTITGLRVTDADGALQYRITGLDLDASELSALRGSAAAAAVIGQLSALDWTVSGTGGANEIRLDVDSTGLNLTNGVKIRGLAGTDTLAGGAGDDTVSGGGGNDRIEDSAGNDKLTGDNGNDVIVHVKGAGGNDTMSGGLGNDTISAGAGNDSIDGGAGADSLNGGAGNDTVLGGAKNDTMLGGSGADEMSGGSGNDQMKGQGGADRMSGGLGNDTVDGGAGNDQLTGDGGADSLVGGGGNDSLAGGLHADTLTGGAGADEFSFGAKDGFDVVTDFNAAVDRIVITMIDSETLNIVDRDGDTLIFHDGQRVTLQGVSSDVLVHGENLFIDTLM